MSLRSASGAQMAFASENATTSDADRATARFCAATLPPRGHSSSDTRGSLAVISRTISWVRSVDASEATTISTRLCRIVELERFSIRRAITSSSLCAATITVTVGKMSRAAPAAAQSEPRRRPPPDNQRESRREPRGCPRRSSASGELPEQLAVAAERDVRIRVLRGVRTAERAHRREVVAPGVHVADRHGEAPAAPAE